LHYSPGQTKRYKAFSYQGAIESVSAMDYLMRLFDNVRRGFGVAKAGHEPAVITGCACIGMWFSQSQANTKIDACERGILKATIHTERK
jgi:hypothetical protein